MTPPAAGKNGATSISARHIFDRLSGPDPALTLYGPSAGAPRLELSGNVLANHCAKAANLLGDDLLLDPGPITFDLPAHWRVVTWGLGSLLAGLNPTFGEESNQPRISAYGGSGDPLILTGLGALDMSWPGDLGDAVDGNAEALAQPDHLLAIGPADVDIDRCEAGRYYLVDPAPGDLLRTALSVFAAGGSLVIVDEAHVAQARGLEGARAWQMCP